MMLVELPFSIKILQVLNPSIMSMMTSRSSCGYFTPLASSSGKTIYIASLFLCFDNGIVWTLLICLYYDFLRDLKELLVVGPPSIILISPMALFGHSCGLSSSLGLSSDLGRFSCFGRPYVCFLMNFCNFPFWINFSIYSLRSLHSSV